MLIEKDLKADGNLMPSVYSLLHSLPEKVLNHEAYGLRHPLGIYNISLSKIQKCFIDTLDAYSQVYDSLSSKEDTVSVSRLVDEQEKLLFSLLSHIDDCYMILKTVFPFTKINVEKNFVDQWLEYAKHPTIGQFKSDISNYRKRLAPLVNKIKHEQGRIRCFYISDRSIFAVGYFIEGTNSNGVIGPNPIIHQGGDTGFSFNRDFKYHLYYLYKISEALVKALKGAIEISYGLEIKQDYFYEGNNSFHEILRKVSDLPYNFFPDELLKPMPNIHFDEECEKISLALPSKVKAIARENNVHITLVTSGDDASRSFIVPYLVHRKYYGEPYTD